MNRSSILARLYPRPLYRQLGLLFTVVFAVVFAAYATVVAYSRAGLVAEMIEQQGRALSLRLADLGAREFQAGDNERLAAVLASATDMPAVISVAATRPSGEVLVTLERADDRRLRATSDTRPDLNAPASIESVTERVASESVFDVTDMFRIWSPVFADAHVGWIRIEVSGTAIAQTRAQVVRDTLVVGSLAVAMVWMLTLVALRRSLAEINQATAFAAKLGSRYGAQLPEGGASLEVASLREALNQASRWLSDQHQALAESDARKQAMFGAALDCIVSTSESGRVIEFNPAAESVFGLSRERAVGRGLAELIVPPRLVGTPIETTWRKVATGDAGVRGRRMELTAGRSDGQQFPVEVTMVAVEAGGQRYFTSFMRDIGRQVAAQRALERSEQHHRSVVEGLVEIVFQTDSSGRFLYLNPAWERVTGYPVAECLGRTAMDLIPEADRPRVTELLRPLAAGTSDSVRDMLRIRRRDDSERWLDVSVRAQLDGRSSAGGFAGSALDVTERRRSEEGLRDQLHLTGELLEVVPSPIYIMDTEGRFVGFNRAYKEAMGIRRRDWLGKTVFDMFPPDLARWHAELDQTLLRETGAQACRARITDAQGRPREAIFNKATFTRADGSLAGILGAVTDVTENQRVEQELMLAKESAEAANRAKTEFLANVSHETRTPMSGIIGMIDLLADTRLDDEQREYLALARSAADKLMNLVNQMLDFARIEKGGLDFEEIRFGLRDAMEVTIAPRRAAAERRGLDFSFAIAPDVPDAFDGDPFRLRQVIGELLDNAVKFTDRGSVGMSIGIDEMTAGDAVVRFTVRDTGVGIPADKLQVVFDAFGQADSSPTRRHGGLGMGLALCQRLARRMDGAITLDSILGAGTTVQFTARLKRAIAVIPEQSVRESLEGLRALVVDPTAGAAMVATLRAHGVLADAAGDLAAACAAAARAQVSGEPIQLVVVDSAPGVTAALEGVAGLRMACGGSPRIMLLTGAGLRGDAARCRAAGIDAYLTRPVKDTELLEAIRMMIPDPDRRAGLITRHSLRERRRSARAEADAPKRAATQRPLFERTAVLENLGGDLDILHEVARASLPDIQTGLTEIRRALENEDAAALVAAAHRTKGVIGNFGAAAAVAKARALEQAGRDGRLEGAGRLLAELSKLAAQLSSELEAELELAASAA